MSTGSYQGKRIGACTDCRNNWASFRAGQIDIEEIADINEELAPTVGLAALQLINTN
jgi:dihydroxy-acid dehydratase